MKVHKALSFHVPIIQDLAKRSWQNTYAQIISVKQYQYMLKRMYSTPILQAHLSDPNWRYFLLSNDTNTFVGFIGYEHDNQPNTTKLHRLYIVPEFMKQGFGKFAVNHVKEAAVKANNNRIILTVNKNNIAQEFYASQGFQIYDSAMFEIGNGFVMDDYLMECFIEDETVQ